MIAKVTVLRCTAVHSGDLMSLMFYRLLLVSVNRLLASINRLR